MFKTDNLLRRLLRISLFTSLLMAVVSVTPFFTVQRVFSAEFFVFFIMSLFVTVLVMWQINIALVYFYEQQKIGRRYYWTRFLLSFVLTAVIAGLLVEVFHSLPLAVRIRMDTGIEAPQKVSIIRPLFSTVFINLFVVFILELVMLREKKAKIELENARLRIEHAEAINQQLRQHIHPHFLFNSMSVLKSLINKNPGLAEEYIIKLSDFLRVSISANEANVVKLSDEYKLCLDYIEMQKIRFGEALHFAFHIPEGRLVSGYVPGFSLQVLLENAIKHNVLTEDMPLHIVVECRQGWLSVSNNIQKKLSSEQTTKLGLANLSDRYRILTGDRIVVEETEEQFTVKVKVLTDEDIDH
ncbi:MAG: histidine kinase [Bacteroidales bacterium]|jgi:sensor histidine kinase YesM|nr:histidine kinase [Bacteroidales bacterium]NLM92107.1 histidine kinase [Bacteroidales bacterium]